MRTLHSLGLILATAATVCALPAYAQGGLSLRAQQQIDLARSACKQSFADTRCATYQTRLVKTVAIETASSRASFREVADRQLDALIATVN